MNDDDEPTPPAPDQQSPAIDLSGDPKPRVEVQCDAVSDVADMSSGDLVAGSPAGLELLPLLGANRDSLVAEAEAETETETEVLVNGMMEMDRESEGVKEVELSDVCDRGDETRVMDSAGKDEDREDVTIEEVTAVSGLLNGKFAGEIEADRKEGTVEEEIPEAGQSLDARDKDVELSGGDEANVLVKQDDELKGKNEGLMVDSCDFVEDGSQTLCKEEMGGKELLKKDVHGEEVVEKGTDDYSRQLTMDTGSKGEEDAHQIDETAGSLIGDSKKVDGEVLLKQDEVTQFEVSAEPQVVADEGKDIVQKQGTQVRDEFHSVTSLDEVGGDELRNEDELVQFDEFAEPQLVAHKGKDIDGEEETQEMDDFESIASQDEVGGDNDDGKGGTEIEIGGETEAGDTKSGSGGKRKRGRAAKSPVKLPKPLLGEDVCFICLDGGELVLCDRRGCTKAYHPSCVDHDEAFFRVKGRWNCGWHLCSSCGKNAYYMCCTCTFSLCKGCIKGAVIFSLRGNKSLCESCMKTVMLIENNVQGNDEMVAFDDKSQWEFLFKDYWMEQKEKLSFTAEEIAHAKNPWKGVDIDNKQTSAAGKNEVNDEAGSASDSSLADAEVPNSKRKGMKKQIKSGKNVGFDSDSSSDKPFGSNIKRKAKKKRLSKSAFKQAGSDADNSNGNREIAVARGKKSKNLAKSHANGGALLNQLAGERNSSHGNQEWASEELMEFVLHMKNGDGSVLSQFDVQALLLEYIKQNKLRDPRRRSQIVCDPMLQKLFGKPRVGHFEMLKLLEFHFRIKNDSQVDYNQPSVVDTEVSQMDDDETATASRGRKSRKKGDDKRLQSNLDDYAAIDMHNISLIYLRRNLMEALLEDSERFQEKVVGSFVRIRISGSMQKQDLYRLVQVVGTSKAAEPYKVGKRTTDLMLEILNLDKTEPVSIDTISNQEFTEDECKRLRQSIKCGLISRLTVGSVLGKAKEFHQVRVLDWLETETERLRHLCDRASDLGHKKELRVNVEKLQRIKAPEERQRRLNEYPVVHADPKMDPSYDSDDESEIEDDRREIKMKSGNGSFRRGSNQFSVPKGGYPSNDSWSPSGMPPQMKWESNRNLSGDSSSSRRDDASQVTETANRNLYQRADRGAPQLNDWEKQRPIVDSRPSKYSESELRNDTIEIPQVDAKIDEADKLWYYRDPSRKVQGPFSMVQLRKWNSSGFFPVDLRIWRTSETEDDSIFLASALAGKFQKEPSQVRADIRHIVASHGSALQHGSNSSVPSLYSQPVASLSSVATSKFSDNIHSLDAARKLDYSNLPSPTPQSSIPSARRHNSASRWSPSTFPDQGGGNGVLPATHTVGSEATQAPRSSNPSMLGNPRQISQLTQNVQVMAHQSHPLSNNTTVSSINALHGGSSLGHSGGAQNPINYPQGSVMLNHGQMPVNPQAWGSAGPQNNPNSTQAQQPGYGYWGNAPPANGHPQPQGAGQFQGGGNVSNQNFWSIPSQTQWSHQVPVNMPWGAATPENHGAGAPPSSNAVWGSMPANSNTGWAGQTPGMTGGMVPSGQVVGQLPGPPAMSPSGSSNVGWSGPVNPNTGWVAPGGYPGSTWGNEQNRSSGAIHQNKTASFVTGAPPNTKGQGVCRFHENGHCKKGASCDYLHI